MMLEVCVTTLRTERITSKLNTVIGKKAEFGEILALLRTGVQRVEKQHTMVTILYIALNVVQEWKVNKIAIQTTVYFLM